MRTLNVPLSLFAALAVSAVALLQAQAPPPRPAQGAAPARSRYVAIGCLSRQAGTQGAAARYLITDMRGEKPTTYRIEGDRALLEQHVGHRVEVAGSMDPVPVNSSGVRPVLRITSLIYIARTCGK
jgi:hypothetical protein